MFGLEKYKDMFGAPKTGAHAYRILDVAIVDVVLTLLLALIIAIIFKQNFVLLSLCLFGFGIIMHRLFGVRTTVDTLLFN
jgi:fatty acid desaturase